MPPSTGGATSESAPSKSGPAPGLNCAAQHLAEFLELQPEEVVEAVRERKAEESRQSRQRRRVKDMKRKEEFEEAVERAVVARLASLVAQS